MAAAERGSQRPRCSSDSKPANGKKYFVVIDYIEALYAVFGRVKKTPDLLYKFNYIHQKRGERLSECISRIDRMLHQIILKKGIDPNTADQARLDWVLQGARQNHPIVLKLLLKGARTVPTYPEVMSKVREEEALLEEKNLGAKEPVLNARRRTVRQKLTRSVYLSRQ